MTGRRGRASRARTGFAACRAWMAASASPVLRQMLVGSDASLTAFRVETPVRIPVARALTVSHCRSVEAVVPWCWAAVGVCLTSPCSLADHQARPMTPCSTEYGNYYCSVCCFPRVRRETSATAGGFLPGADNWE